MSRQASHAETPDLDWVLPDDGGVRWMQAIGVFANSEKQQLATEFVKYILCARGSGAAGHLVLLLGDAGQRPRPALTAEQKQVLRWDEQPGFIAKSYPYFIPNPELDAKMLEVWTEFLQH